MSLTVRAEQVAWLEANLPLDEKEQGQITQTLAMGDALPDVVITSLYQGQVKAQADRQAEADKQAEIKKKALELEQHVLTHPLTIGVEGWFGEEEGDKVIKQYFVKVSVGKSVKWAIRDEANLTMAANAIRAVKAQAQLLAKKQAEGKPVKGSRKRRSASDKVDEWVINTEDDAKAQYKAGLYASKYDLENKAIYKEQMKTYKAGVDDPRPDQTGKLTTDLVKYQYKAVVRADELYNAEDDKRCAGAVAWKGGRYGSLWAAKKGFKGSVMSQCSKQVSDGVDFCAGCSGKKLDFFEGKYKKSNIKWVDGFDDEGQCVVIQ